ncbi:T9SS type A sorting domain-containing protein, partial [bacterium]|nr:T9SS type A sorting domain-containing protein [bacterium]
VFAPVMVMNQSASEIRGNTIGPVSDNAYPGEGVWAYLADGVTIDSNTVTGMIDAGILIWGCSNTSVTRNLVDQCFFGVSFEGTAGGALYNNTIDDCTNSGVYIAGLSGTLTARNNNITNGIFGFCWVDSSGTVSSDYNNVWGNTWNYQDPQGPGDTNTVAAGAHDLSADPLYDGARHLQAASPCINAGTPVGLPYLGAAPDIGAFEDWAKSLAGGGVLAAGPFPPFSLRQNHPNPFSGRTTISYQLPSAGHVSLKIYNIAGQLVRVLADGQRPAGLSTVSWDGRDDRGRTVSAGVYHYRLAHGGGQQVRTLLFIK